jgi:hypothetical protein
MARTARQDLKATRVHKETRERRDPKGISDRQDRPDPPALWDPRGSKAVKAPPAHRDQ